MKINNDMNPVTVEGGVRYTLEDDKRTVDIFHFEMDFGVVVNIGEVRGDDFLSSGGGEDDSNLIGIIACLSGSVDTCTPEGNFTQIPGTAVFGQPSNKRTEMMFPGGRYRGIGIGFRPNLDIPRIGDDPDSRYILATLKTRFEDSYYRPFKLPIELIMVIEALQISLKESGTANREFLRRRCAEIVHLLYCIPDIIYPDVPTTKNLAVLDRMCCNLTDDLANAPNIKQMCNDEGLNEFWFIRNFKKRYGYTPYEYHKIARHTRAAAMIISDNYQVGEVARMTGYASQSKFSMAFREIYGCRPKHFPKQFEIMLEECAKKRHDFED